MRVRFRNHWLLAVNVATGRLAPPAAADEAWKPHLEESNGEAKELGDPKELKDKDWLGIRYGEYSGYKTRLGVVFSEVEAAYPPKYRRNGFRSRRERLRARSASRASCRAGSGAPGTAAPSRSSARSRRTGRADPARSPRCHRTGRGSSRGSPRSRAIGPPR